MPINSLLKFLPLVLLSPALAYAQLYSDASGNLPNNGARGPSMDVRAGDLDGDGDLDLVLAREFQPNVMLLNNGTGSFTNGTAGRLPQPSHDSEDVAIADFDRDGDLDLIFCSEDDVRLGRTNVHEYYLNDGTGRFSAAPYIFPDSEANAVIAADLTGDGAAEVLFGNNGQDFLLINRGDGTFVNETAARLPSINDVTQDLLLSDIDNDSDLDLFAGNENGNRLLINDGSAKFADETSARLPSGSNMETRKVAAGDVDSDGDQDIFLSNVGFLPGKNRQNRLFLNNGQGFFSDASSARLPPDNEDTLDGIFEDVDLDADLDLVVANVNLQLAGKLRIYLNDGAGYFSDRTSSVLPRDYITNALGVIAADLTGDHFNDLYFCDRNNGTVKDILLARQPSTSVAQPEGPPARNFVLWQNYPNPFNPTTTIRYEIPRATLVVLKVLTIRGEEIRILANERQSAGSHAIIWDGTDYAGRAVPSGIYLYMLRAGNYAFSRKLSLLR